MLSIISRRLERIFTIIIELETAYSLLKKRQRPNDYLGS